MREITVDISTENEFTTCYTKIWIWESYLQDGCRVCSQLIKNEIKESFLSVVWISRLFILQRDLVACDLFLFANLKKWLERNLDIKLIDAVNSCFEEKDKSYCIKDIKKLKHRCINCIKFKGDHIGK